MESDIWNGYGPRADWLQSPAAETPELLACNELGLAEEAAPPESGYAYTPRSMHEYFAGLEGGLSTFPDFPYPDLGYRVDPNDWDPNASISPAMLSTMDCIDDSNVGLPSFQDHPVDPAQWR